MATLPQVDGNEQQLQQQQQQQQQQKQQEQQVQQEQQEQQGQQDQHNQYQHQHQLEQQERQVRASKRKLDEHAEENSLASRGSSDSSISKRARTVQKQLVGSTTSTLERSTSGAQSDAAASDVIQQQHAVISTNAGAIGNNTVSALPPLPTAGNALTVPLLLETRRQEQQRSE